MMFASRHIRGYLATFTVTSFVFYAIHFRDLMYTITFTFMLWGCYKCLTSWTPVRLPTLRWCDNVVARVHLDHPEHYAEIRKDRDGRTRFWCSWLPRRHWFSRSDVPLSMKMSGNHRRLFVAVNQYQYNCTADGMGAIEGFYIFEFDDDANMLGPPLYYLIDERYEDDYTLSHDGSIVCGADSDDTRIYRVDDVEHMILTSRTFHNIRCGRMRPFENEWIQVQFYGDNDVLMEQLVHVSDPEQDQAPFRAPASNVTSSFGPYVNRDERIVYSKGHVFDLEDNTVWHEFFRRDPDGLVTLYTIHRVEHLYFLRDYGARSIDDVFILLSEKHLKGFEEVGEHMELQWLDPTRFKVSAEFPDFTQPSKVFTYQLCGLSPMTYKVVARELERVLPKVLVGVVRGYCRV